MKARKLGSIGDVNPIEYGGGPIYTAPESGGPWVEYFYGLDEDERASRISRDYDLDEAEEKIDQLKVQVYRVDLGKGGREFLSEYDWVDWEAVAASGGQDLERYDAKNLKTASERANAVWDAAGHYGWHEFDQYPLELTIAALRERWD